jgi:hypothetical protein
VSSRSHIERNETVQRVTHHGKHLLYDTLLPMSAAEADEDVKE